MVSGFPCDLADEESCNPACNAGDLGLISGLGRFPGEGNSHPLQYSGLENSMERVVHGVAKSWTRLSDFRFHFHTVVIAGQYRSLTIYRNKMEEVKENFS